jgi:transposase-like protein
MSNEIQKVNRQVKMAQWANLVRDCRSSGLTVNHWCQENHIKPSTYYYWLKVLRQAALSAHECPDVSFTEIPLPKKKKESANDTILTIHLDCKGTIEVNSGIPSELLTCLIRSL